MDLAPGIEYQQITIAREDQLCPAVEGDFKEFVILRVAALPYPMDDGNQFGNAAEQSKKLLAIRKTDVTIKLGTSENVCELKHGCFRYKE